MKKLFILLAIFTTLASMAQSLGINADGSAANASAMLDVSSTNKGFLPPRMTSAQRLDIASPATGLMVYQNDANTGNYIYNGSSWVLLSNANYGDIKTGIQSTDHNGWIILDGRLLSGLSTTQQAQATALGIGANLPDATNAYLVQNGGSLGTVGGSNSKTIARSDLPNFSQTFNTSANGAHSHQVPTVSGGTGSNPSRVPQGSNGTSITANIFTSTEGSHSHTITIPSLNGGVTQTSFDITPKSLSVNTFIYLGF
jgi:microcystin-dependent protein